MLARKILYYLYLTRGSFPVERRKSLLRDTIERAYADTEFYRELWDSHKVGPDELEDRSDLGKLPVVTKADIRQKLSEEAPSASSEPEKAYSSSGSSDEPLKIVLDEKAHDMREANYLRALRHTGFHLRDRMAYYWYEDFDRHFFNRFVMRKERIDVGASLDKQIEQINSYRPEALYYYPSMLFSLAKYVKQSGKKVEKPDYILTQGEILTPGMRSAIEEVFEAPANDRYAMAEFGDVAFQCQEGGYHLNSENLMSERLSSRCGERLVLTDLRNRATPLVRYDTGDIIEDGECGCGLESPSFSRILGRAENFIETEDGLFSPYRMIELLADLDDLLHFKLVQVDSMEFRMHYVENREFQERVLEEARRRLSDLLGEISIEFSRKKRINPENRGKMPMVERHDG